MSITGDAALTATKQEVISSLVQSYLVSEAVLAPTVRDVSQFAIKGAETLSFPKRGGFTVENRASAAAATIQNLTYQKDTMALDQRATVSWLIDTMDEIESVVDVQADYIQVAAQDHAVYVDTQLIAEMETVGVPTTTAGDITKDIFLEMRRALKQRKARNRQLYFACSPAQEEILLGIPQFVEADKFGSAIIPNGVLGRLYGVQVVVSPELGDQQFFMYAPDSMALGFQRAPRFDEEKAISYGAGSMQQIIDQKFGVKGCLLGLQGVLATESALMVKDNNA